MDGLAGRCCHRALEILRNGRTWSRRGGRRGTRSLQAALPVVGALPCAGVARGAGVARPGSIDACGIAAAAALVAATL